MNKRSVSSILIALLSLQTALHTYHDHSGFGWGAGLMTAGILGAAIASRHREPQVVYVPYDASTRPAERVVDEEDEYAAKPEETRQSKRKRKKQTTTQPSKKFKPASDYRQEPELDEEEISVADQQIDNQSEDPKTATQKIVYEDED